MFDAQRMDGLDPSAQRQRAKVVVYTAANGSASSHRIEARGSRRISMPAMHEAVSAAAAMPSTVWVPGIHVLGC